jgi:LysR family glycine cleavage system transcriptional activator
MSLSPIRPKGPSLNALRALEAAIRLSSYKRAAEELSVTPAAISQHIKSLEAWAGQEFFTRGKNNIAPNAAARSVLPLLSESFDMLGQTAQGLRAVDKQHSITIAALPSVAQLWLSPRLPKIRKLLAPTVISVVAMEQKPNLLRDFFDLSIFYGKKDAAPRENILAEDWIFPVCAPALAAKINTIADIFHFPFLHDSTWAEDWTTWLNHAAISAQFAVRPHGVGSKGLGPHFSLYAMALEECKNMGGLLIGHSALVQKSLEEQSLIAPFDVKIDTQKALIFEVNHAMRHNAKIKALIAVLQEKSTTDL